MVPQQVPSLMEATGGGGTGRDRSDLPLHRNHSGCHSENKITITGAVEVKRLLK